MTAGPLAWFRREIFGKTLPASLILQLAGVTALLLGVAIFRQARNRIPTRTMFGLPELEPHKHKQPLLNTGIYSKTRNPIYFAHWLVVFSAAALSGFVANWVFFALDCVLLPLMIRAEERELAGRYGREFAAYMRRVPRFFPKLR
jgi:protein-S-isoprenylcysteine O-methyltransferase Ste14